MKDCFSLEILTESFNKWLKDENYNIKIDIKFIKENLNKDESIINFFNKFLYKNEIYGLKKTELAEYIANVTIEKLNKEELQKTKVGEVISRIVEEVEKKYI